MLFIYLRDFISFPTLLRMLARNAFFQVFFLYKLSGPHDKSILLQSWSWSNFNPKLALILDLRSVALLIFFPCNQPVDFSLFPSSLHSFYMTWEHLCSFPQCIREHMHRHPSHRGMPIHVHQIFSSLWKVQRVILEHFLTPLGLCCPLSQDCTWPSFRACGDFWVEGRHVLQHPKWTAME